MNAKILLMVTVGLCSQASQLMACSVCFGAPESKTTQSMAIAIWFLLAAVMAVLGGVGAFSFHLWRQGRMPLEPHQELAEEDLNQYD
jgi:hypothetical protein